MNMILRTTFLALTLGACAGLANAHGSLDGETLLVEYGIDFGSGFTALSSRTITVGSGLEVSGWSLSSTKDIRWDIDFSGGDIAFTYVGQADFMNVGTFAMQGFRISNVPLEIEEAMVTNTTYVPGVQGNLIEGFDPATALTFTASTVSVNLNESMYHHHAMTGMGDPVRDAIKLHLHLAPAVPEPEAWTLAGLGLLGIAALRRRRQG
jgi:MYXO-CTERM domain-containing protein